MPSQADYERRIQRAQQQLKDELTEAGLKIHQARAEASSWSSMQSQAKMEQDNKDLQDFLTRRRSSIMQRKRIRAQRPVHLVAAASSCE